MKGNAENLTCFPSMAEQSGQAHFNSPNPSIPRGLFTLRAEHGRLGDIIPFVRVRIPRRVLSYRKFMNFITSQWHGISYKIKKEKPRLVCQALLLFFISAYATYPALPLSAARKRKNIICNMKNLLFFHSKHIAVNLEVLFSAELHSQGPMRPRFSRGHFGKSGLHPHGSVFLQSLFSFLPHPYTLLPYPLSGRPSAVFQVPSCS